MRTANRDRQIETVVRFLKEQGEQAESIFLDGDLFDFWFEWRQSVPGGSFRVLAELHRLVKAGKRIVYLAGNHDGHLGRFLTDEVGLEISREPLDVEIAGQKIHLIHGDGLAPSDRGYRILRGLVRWKPTEAIFRLVHPDFGIWFAHRLSGYSRHHLSPQNDFGAEPYREYAKSKLDSGLNYVVIGHRHYSEFVGHQNGGYIAIGDWMNSGSYGYLGNDGRMQLRFFKE